ncbi:MAG: hypothetical protein HGJ97_08295 [Desulfosporosinus sp.]|nr:hypothetical protein [Desulfosporosinus sp.]
MKRIFFLSLIGFLLLTGGCATSSPQTLATPTKQVESVKPVGLPDSKTLENATGQFGTVVKTLLVQFKSGETFAVLGEVAPDIQEGDQTNVQVFIVQYNAKSDSWQTAWKLPAPLQSIHGVDKVFSQDFYKVVNDQSALVAFGIPVGVSSVSALKVIQINRDGDISLQKDTEVPNLKIEIKDQTIIASGGTPFGAHQMSLNSGQVFMDVVTTPSQLGNDQSDVVKVYFTVKDGEVIPDNGGSVKLKVGSSIVFTPKDQATAQLIDAGKISIYTNAQYKDEHVGPYGTFYTSSSKQTFKETGKVEYLMIADFSKTPNNPSPTFIIEVTQ